MERYSRSDRAFHIDALHMYEIKDEEDKGMFVLDNRF
jgi:hypothetical protein